MILSNLKYLFAVCTLLTVSSLAKAQEALPVVALESATAAAPSLDQLYITQWVTPTANGSLIGRVVTPGETQGIPGVQVSLRRQGQTVQSSVSDGDGNFQFVNVVPNYYSVIAEGDGVFAAYALTVIGSARGKHLPSNFEVPVIRPTGNVVLDLIRTQTAPISSWTSFPTFSSADPVGTGRVTHRMIPIPLNQDGSFTGNFSYPGIPEGIHDMSNYIAYLVKDGRRFMQTPLDRDGEFRFDKVPVGNYGIVVLGNRGFSAVGVQLVDSRVAFSSTNGQRYVSQGTASPFHLEIIPRNDVPTTIPDPNDPNFPQNEIPLPMGSFGGPGFGSPFGGGGGFGGGAGGGGGFGGGGLFAAAGLAGIAAAIALDDDDNDNLVSPIGP
jgi:uncharacterized membrane protein YgcG